MPSEGNTRERRATELLRNAADVVVEIDRDGRMLYVSEAIEPILSRRAADFVGRSFIDAVAPEDHALVLAEFRKVIESGAEPRLRFHAVRRDGQRVEFEASARSYRNTQGQRRVVVVARDITAEASEASATRRRSAYYRALVESGGRPAAILSPAGRLRFSNQAFRRSFGAEAGFHDVLSGLDDASRQALETAWYASNQPDQDGSGTTDVEYAHPDGRTDWLCLRWQRFELDDGARAIAVTFDDIGGRKRVETALSEMARSTDDEPPAAIRAHIERLAEALPIERLSLGLVDPARPERLELEALWQDGRFTDDGDELDIALLPEAIVARGETCIYPSSLASLVPATTELIGPDFESFAGVPIRLGDGSTVGVLSAYARRPLVDGDQTRSLLAALATRIAARLDRQNALAEIRTNRDRFESLARQSHEILAEVDDSGVITYVSPACEAVLGHDPASLVGLHVNELAHNDDWPIELGSHQRLMSGAPATIVVSRVRHADGSWRWLESRACPFTDSVGANRSVILSRDVTERRDAELGRSLFHRVVQTSNDWVFVCEPDTTRLVFANEAATRDFGSLTHATGIDREDASRQRPGQPDRTFFDLLPSHESSRLREIVLPALSPSQSWSGELQLLRQGEDGGEAEGEGATIPTEATLLLLQDEDAAERTYLGITLHDIGGRRSAEEALRQSELRLSQAQKMEAVGRLAGGIAHDFNNLLTAIIGYSDLVLDALGEGHVAHEDAQEIMRAAERAGGLTRQLLAFSRRQVLRPESVDLNEIVSGIDNMMRRLLGESIALVTDLDGGLRRIVADPGQMEQVLVNLLVNARDAMPQGGGQIRIETANFDARTELRTESGLLHAGEYIRLTVSDTGLGMSDDTRARIFEPFFTTKESHEGTGLGLATVYGIVNQSGGQIDVESAPSAGSRFEVYLPACRDAAQDEGRPTLSEAEGGRETILVLEDAAAVRRLIVRSLERAGYRVLEAESATAALRHCGRHQGEIDLMLCDVVLPRANGPEIASRAAELRPGLSVLFMSGFSDETLVKQGLTPRQTQLLEKPFTPSTLLARVRGALDDACYSRPA